MILSRKKRISPQNRIILIAILMVAALFLLVSIAEMYRGLVLSQKRLEKVEKLYDKTSNQENNLVNEYNDLTNAEGVEYYVRKHYRAVSEGEELVVLVDPDEYIGDLPPVEPLSFWEKVRILLRIP